MTQQGTHGLPPDMYLFGIPTPGPRVDEYGLVDRTWWANAGSGSPGFLDSLVFSSPTDALLPVPVPNNKWAYVDLSTYTISINGSPFRPVADIAYVRLVTGPILTAACLGFDRSSWFYVAVSRAGDPTVHDAALTDPALLALVHHLIPYMGLPAPDDGRPGATEPEIVDASRRQLVEFAARFFPRP